MLKTFLRFFGKLERPVGWAMLLGGLASFIGVLFDLIYTGDFKLATLLIAADLFVSGFGAAQDAENEIESDTKEAKLEKT